MTVNWANVLGMIKWRCIECGKYVDAPKSETLTNQWVCPGCTEVLASGLPDDREPVVGDPD